MKKALLIGTTATICLVSSLASAQSRYPDGFDLSPSQLVDLENGELIIDSERGDMNRGEVIGIIDGPIEEVGLIIADVEAQTEWFPDTEESEEISRDGETARIRGRTNVPWPIADRHYELNAEHTEHEFDGVSCHVFTFEYVPGSGNMDDTFGWWLLCPYGDNQTLAEHVLYADLGIWLPDAVLNWATRRMLPGIIDGLREYHADNN